MFVPGRDHGSRIVRVVAASATVLGGCWVFAFNRGNDGVESAWPVAAAAVVVVVVTSLVWLFSKIAHGGDWAHWRDRGRRRSISAAVPGHLEPLG